MSGNELILALSIMGTAVALWVGLVATLVWLYVKIRANGEDLFLIGLFGVVLIFIAAIAALDGLGLV